MSSMNAPDARALAKKRAETGIPALPLGLSWNFEKNSIDKKPLSSSIAKNGFYDASIDPQRVEEMFLRARLGPGQDWGVGVRPGPAGYIVLDVDVKNGGTGLEDLARLTKELGPLPKAMKVNTASGGFHLWLRRPDKPSEIGNGHIAPGIEIRCDKGYVVAPGTTSRWGDWTRDPDTPRLSEVEQLPDNWAARLNGISSTGAKEPIAEKLTVGSRHDALVSMAGAMRRRGGTAEEILAALTVMNRNRCDPPHSASKLEEIAEDISGRWQHEYQHGKEPPDPETPEDDPYEEDRPPEEEPFDESTSAEEPDTSSARPGGAWIFDQPEKLRRYGATATKWPGPKGKRS